jgi:hypothetical protein
MRSDELYADLVKAGIQRIAVKTGIPNDPFLRKCACTRNSCVTHSCTRSKVSVVSWGEAECKVKAIG